MMENFQYYAPTKVVFGKGTENKAGQLVKEQNCRKVLIHYGSGSVKRSGLLEVLTYRYRCPFSISRTGVELESSNVS